MKERWSDKGLVCQERGEVCNMEDAERVDATETGEWYTREQLLEVKMEYGQRCLMRVPIDSDEHRALPFVVS